MLRRLSAGSCWSDTSNLGVDVFVVGAYMRRKTKFGAIFGFVKKVADRSPNISSIAAGCVKFLTPVRCRLLEWVNFLLLFNAWRHLDCASSFLSVLNLSFQASWFLAWSATVFVVEQCLRQYIVIFDGVISSKLSVIMLLYCTLRWSTSDFGPTGMHSEDDLSRQLKYSVVNGVEAPSWQYTIPACCRTDCHQEQHRWLPHWVTNWMPYGMTKKRGSILSWKTRIYIKLFSICPPMSRTLLHLICSTCLTYRSFEF